jgi:hypothetical protein
MVSLLFVPRARADDGTAPSATGPDPALSAEYRPGAWQLALFYFLLFVLVFLGIAAKGVFDNFKPGKSLWDCLKGSVPAFFVSPILVLGLAKVADVGLESSTSGIITLLTAFQNGFFWRTVLVKGEETASSRTRAESGPPDRPAALMPDRRGSV